MGSRILVINGHPDPRHERFCWAIAAAYSAGAHESGRLVRRIDIGTLDFPLLRTMEDFQSPAAPAELKDAQTSIRWADHLVIIHPLWLGGQPAMLRAFLEQVLRYGFALGAPNSAKPGGLLKGRSAHIIVTMGMPGLIFRLAFGAFGLRALERGVLWLCGFSPIRRTVLGGVDSVSDARRAAWLKTAYNLGSRGI